MSAPLQRRFLTAWMIALCGLAVGAVAVQQAVVWYQHPFAGVLLSPQGIVSSIGLPTWSGIAQGIRFPDRAVAIDGAELRWSREPDEAVMNTWDRAIDDAWKNGHPSVHVRFKTDAGDREVDLRLDRLDSPTWWLYGGGNFFQAGLWMLAAIIATAASSSGLARTFTKAAAAGALFMVAFFDIHTTRAIAPLGLAAYAYAPFAVAQLALRLPDDLPLVARHPTVLRALDALGIALALVMVLNERLGIPAGVMLNVCSLNFGGSLVAFWAILGTRFARATGARRETMGILLRAMATPLGIVAMGILISRFSSKEATTVFFAIPVMALAPVSTAVAFARHDLWGSRAILSRVLARSVSGGVAGVIAVGIGAAFAASLGIAFRGALVGASLGALVAGPLVYFATRFVERRFFPAATEYKPTIEQLSEELTSITDPKEVALAVERTVRRWLPCERVGFVTSYDGQAAEGSAPRLPRTPSEDEELCVPASFGGRTLGWLSVGRKRGGALFTTDDIDLLGTIANQAGLALAHAHSYAELERRRQQQAAAWQTERLALVETVAAEIAHEVRYPINFFRSVFRRENGNATLDAEEIDIGCEEVDRLERLVSGLRRMVGHRIDRRVMLVTDLTSKAEMLLRDALAGRSLEVDIVGEPSLRCDTDQITQVLVNLVANAIDASGPRGRVGLRWSNDEENAELVVWDDGPGFEADPSHLFSAWFTTKPRGTGLGLAITQRIVRSHGWVIDAVRVEGRTHFVVTIPMSDVVVNERDSEPVAGTETLTMAARGGEHEDSDRR